MRAARLRHWLDAKDPGLVAVKRALRVTLVACAAFYFSLYLLHDSQMATFASFGCIAFGALSDGRHLYRRAVAVEELAVWTRDLAEATKIMLGERVWEPRARSVAEPFWYANRSAPSLWFTRFVGHFTPRSVFFQNAIRLAIGLAAARLIAGVFDLSHGFWMCSQH
jgi:uncharacterized membrane protein YccC